MIPRILFLYVSKMSGGPRFVAENFAKTLNVCGTEVIKATERLHASDIQTDFEEVGKTDLFT